MRPLLHHTVGTGWVNDPYGLTFHDGEYHLFFQYVPGRTVWDVGCHWGHATSPDLLTWTPQPVALTPGDGDDGCWSGSLAGGSAFYTSVSADAPDLGRVRRAVPTDARWTTWRKQEVVATAPPEATHFRDPFVRRDGDTWRMVVGGATADGPALWSFRSDDLNSWEPEGIAASRSAEETGGVWTGRAWECPAIVEVSGRTVLLVSAWEPAALQYVAYSLCSPDGPELHPGAWQRLSYGPSLYAASAFLDPGGRPGLVAWLREVSDATAGWAGATSLPVLVSLQEGRLVVRALEGLPPGADRTWLPAVGDVVEGPNYALTAREASILVTSGPWAAELPWTGGPLRLVVDSAVLELYGDHGWAAVPTPAT